MSGEKAVGWRSVWIDSARALAALSVVFFHVNVMPFTGEPGHLTRLWRAFWGWGHLGVPVFFAISGYCVTIAWHRAKGVGDFAFRRFRRLFPPYWASIALLLALAAARWYFVGVNDVAVLPRGTWPVLATLLAATEPASHVKTMNWVYWTLTCEVSFYAIMALTLLAPRRRVALLAAVHLILCAVAVVPGVEPRGPLFFAAYWPMFGIGAVLAAYSFSPRASLIMFAASVIGAGVAARDWSMEIYLLASFATTLFLWATSAAAMPSILGPVSQLGKFAYSLYLIHVPVAIDGLMHLLPSGFPSDSIYILSQLLIVATTIAAAWVFYVAAEKRFILPPRAR
jgi:peptidoglycan/LPS O-acetylase OafA/YrhL